jgi:hypothetical protein
MNKIGLSIVILAVVAIAFGSVGYVYAQSPTPATPVPGAGMGYGMMGGGRGNRGGMMGQNVALDTQEGLLHDEMIAVFAEKLGISVDDLNTRLTNGESMAQIAASKGQSADQFSALMTAARNQAIDQALKNGSLTQAQADWMRERGAGRMNGGSGMRGNGQGRNANTDCPYSPQTNP